MNFAFLDQASARSSRGRPSRSGMGWSWALEAGGSASAFTPRARSIFAKMEAEGHSVAASLERPNPGDILVLENTRFHPEEEKNSIISKLFLHAL